MSMTDRGLIHHFKFDETTGTTADDVGPQNRDIALYGTAGNEYAWYASGKVDRGLMVNVRDYQASTPCQIASGYLNLSGDFTLSVWVNLIVLDTHDNNLYNLDSSYSSFAINTWFHLCARRTGNKLDYWINGTKKIDNRTVSTADLRLDSLAGYPTAAMREYNPGKMRVDALRIYNLALSDAEVAELATEDTSNVHTVYPYKAYSVTAGDQPQWITIEPAEIYSQATGDDAFWVIEPMNCYSAAAADDVLVSTVLISETPTHSVAACDELTLEVEYAYPFGPAALAQEPQAISAESGGVAEIAQELQRLSASGDLSLAGDAAVQMAKQTICAEGNLTGDLKMDRQTMVAGGYPDQVGEFSARMLAQVLSGEGFADPVGSAALRMLPQSVRIEGGGVVADGACMMSPQRMEAYGVVGIAGDGILELLPQVLTGAGGLDGYGEGAFNMDPHIIKAVGSSPSRFANFILAYPTRG